MFCIVFVYYNQVALLHTETGLPSTLDNLQFFRYKQDIHSFCRNRKNNSIFMREIDSEDRQIINLLMEDGRMTAAEIARRLGGGISERVVRYRIEHLVQEQIIRISAIVNPRAAGYVVVADVWLEVEADALQEVAQKMTGYEFISYVAYAIGEQDVSIQIIARDADEVYYLVTEIIGKTPGVRKTRTSIVPQVLKDVYQWQIPSSDYRVNLMRRNLHAPID